MNRYMQEHGDLLRQTQALRDQLMDMLSDADLSYSPGGDNLTLGELCKESGDIEYAYIQSLKTFKQDWSYQNPEPGLAASVTKLCEWFKGLDADYQKVAEALTDDDLNKMIDRGFQVPVGGQLHIYREGLLIFYGKAMIYLKALKKTVPDQWRFWIG